MLYVIMLLINIYFELIIHFNGLFIVQFHTMDFLLGEGARARAGAREENCGEGSI